MGVSPAITPKLSVETGQKMLLTIFFLNGLHQIIFFSLVPGPLMYGIKPVNAEIVSPVFKIFLLICVEKFTLVSSHTSWYITVSLKDMCMLCKLKFIGPILRFVAQFSWVQSPICCHYQCLPSANSMSLLPFSSNMSYRIFHRVGSKIDSWGTPLLIFFVLVSSSVWCCFIYQVTYHSLKVTV